MQSFKDSDKNIPQKGRELAKQFPTEANKCSRRTLWKRAWDEGVVDREEYYDAQNYYGKLWYTLPE